MFSNLNSLLISMGLLLLLQSCQSSPNNNNMFFSLKFIKNIPRPIKYGALIVTLLEICIRIPPETIYQKKLLELPQFNESSIAIIFHGAGGPDSNTQQILQQIRKSDKKNKIKRFVIMYDWTDWRGNIVRAAYDSQTVGRLLGKQLANKSLDHVHSIGISVGAFAADSLITTLKKQSKTKPALLHLTLLDPFCSRGIWPNNYGINNFGKTADYAEQYLNTDDPVPFTNKPIKYAHVIDITHSEAKKKFTPLPNDNMHSWPAYFYGKFFHSMQGLAKNGVPTIPNHLAKPRGKVTSLIKN